jgi:hypothetical protein
MTFKPAHSAIKHLISTQNDASDWLKSIQGDPFSETRSLFSLSCDPEAPKASSRKYTLPNGPVVPTATCSETGRELKLHVFRDLSAVLMRRGASADVAWEVFPAALTLSSEIYEKSLTETDYKKRATDVARIKFQARPEGIYWRQSIPDSRPSLKDTVDAGFIQDLLSSELPDLARSILKAPPVADPRFHRMVPDGARFAPFSVWPDRGLFHGEIQQLETLVKVFLDFYVQDCSASELHLHITRRAPHTPWRSSNRTSQVIVRPASKDIAKALRRLLSDPRTALPDAVIYGPQDDVLLNNKASDIHSSQHARIEALKTLSHILGDKNWRCLCSSPEA